MVLDNFLWKKRYDHCWLYILILFYFSALFSVDCLDFNLLIGMDFKVQMVVFLSLILFSYLLCFGSFTLSLTFPEDNRCMGCFWAWYLIHHITALCLSHPFGPIEGGMKWCPDWRFDFLFFIFVLSVLCFFFV